MYDERSFEERYRATDALWSGRPNTQLVAEVADLLGAILEVIAEAIGLILKLFLQRGLHERRAAQEPDREREEDRDDRHDVVSERDHRSSFRSNSHWRNCSTSCETYSRSGGETTTTAAIVTSAAATSNPVRSHTGVSQARSRRKTSR